MTQEFFTDVMMRPGFKPTKESGKFRSLLYASLQNHLLSWHRKGQAKKRGGDYYINSLDEQSGDHPQDLPSIEPVMRDVLDRLVAEQVWELARERLRTKYDAAGKKTTFVHLINNLGSVGGPSNAEIANVLEMTEDSVKQEKTKMRRQLKECFYQEVALEFPNPLGQKQEIEQEVLYLRGLLYSPFFEIRSLDC